MSARRGLLIIGDSAFAEIAYEYFTNDSEYEVAAFCVEQAYLKRTELFGLPVVAFETLEERFKPDDYVFFAANVYTKLNRLRTRLYHEAKARGYAPASYVSSHARVQPDVTLGEHCFVFENNLIQSHATLEDNVVLWSGNQIGRHARIGQNTFIASHAVIGQGASIGANCFVGVNVSVSDRVSVGDDCMLGAAALVRQDVPNDKVVRVASGETREGARARAGLRTGV